MGRILTKDLHFMVDRGGKKHLELSFSYILAVDWLLDNISTTIKNKKERKNNLMKGKSVVVNI